MTLSPLRTSALAMVCPFLVQSHIASQSSCMSPGVFRAISLMASNVDLESLRLPVANLVLNCAAAGKGAHAHAQKEAA